MNHTFTTCPDCGSGDLTGDFEHAGYRWQSCNGCPAMILHALPVDHMKVGAA